MEKVWLVAMEINNFMQLLALHLMLPHLWESANIVCLTSFVKLLLMYLQNFTVAEVFCNISASSLYSHACCMTCTIGAVYIFWSLVIAHRQTLDFSDARDEKLLCACSYWQSLDTMAATGQSMWEDMQKVTLHYCVKGQHTFYVAPYMACGSVKPV